MESVLACENWFGSNPPLQFFLTNDQKRPMYECIQVYSYREQDSVLNEEGDLDNESDDSDFEMEMMRKSRYRESVGSETSITARYGSPMSVE
jgi:hypothetical protein